MYQAHIPSSSPARAWICRFGRHHGRSGLRFGSITHIEHLVLGSGLHHNRYDEEGGVVLRRGVHEPLHLIRNLKSSAPSPFFCFPSSSYSLVHLHPMPSSPHLYLAVPANTPAPALPPPRACSQQAVPLRNSRGSLAHTWPSVPMPSSGRSATLQPVQCFVKLGIFRR